MYMYNRFFLNKFEKEKNDHSINEFGLFKCS